jgi:hypothetical protein
LDRQNADGHWGIHDISVPEEVKFDRIEFLDLDVITCEEAENLGVIWHENPAR